MSEVYKIPYFLIIILSNAITVNPKIEIFHLIAPILILYVFYKNEDSKYTIFAGLTLFLLGILRQSNSIMYNSLDELGDLNTYIESLKQGLDFPISMIFYKLFSLIFGIPLGLKILVIALSILLCSLFMIYFYKNDNKFLFSIIPAMILFDPAFHYVMQGMIRTLIGLTILTCYLTLSNKNKIQRMFTSALLSFTHLLSLTWFLCLQIIEGIVKREKKTLYSFIPVIASIPILIYLGSNPGLLNASIDRWIRYFKFIFYYPETKLKLYTLDFANLSLWPIAYLSMIGLITIKLLDKKNNNLLIWIPILLLPFLPLQPVYSWRLLYISNVPLLMALNEIKLNLMDRRIITSFAFLNVNSSHQTISQIVGRILNPNISLIINIIYVSLFHINLFLPKKVIQI